MYSSSVLVKPKLRDCSRSPTTMGTTEPASIPGTVLLGMNAVLPSVEVFA